MKYEDRFNPRPRYHWFYPPRRSFDAARVANLLSECYVYNMFTFSIYRRQSERANSSCYNIRCGNNMTVEGGRAAVFL